MPSSRDDFYLIAFSSTSALWLHTTSGNRRGLEKIERNKIKIERNNHQRTSSGSAEKRKPKKVTTYGAVKIV